MNTNHMPHQHRMYTYDERRFTATLIAYDDALGKSKKGGANSSTGDEDLTLVVRIRDVMLCLFDRSWSCKSCSSACVNVLLITLSNVF